MTDNNENIAPFALSDRWIVTVESERVLVKVRHRTRWYAIARRNGHEDRRHWCASREDALWIAERMREAFEAMADYDRIKAMYDAMTDTQRARIHAQAAMRRARNAVQNPRRALGGLQHTKP